jgi:hypothetical protein
MTRLVAAGGNSPERRWELHYRYPDSDTSIFGLPVIVMTPNWTLDVSVTTEEAQLIAASGRRLDRIRMSADGYELWVNGAEVTEFEAARIRMGENPVDVLLRRGYWLAVVPWRPAGGES